MKRHIIMEYYVFAITVLILGVSVAGFEVSTTMFTDEEVNMTTASSVYDVTTRVLSTEDSPTTPRDDSKGKSDEEFPLIMIIGAVVGFVVVVVGTVIVTLLCVKCCCAKNTRMCPSCCCACCMSPEAPPPRLPPPKAEVDFRHSGPRKDDSENKAKTDGKTGNIAQGCHLYENDEMAKHKGRAKANTYTSAEQEMYTNVTPDFHEISTAVPDSGQDIQLDDVTVVVEAEEQTLYQNEEGLQEEIAQAAAAGNQAQAAPGSSDEQEMYTNLGAVNQGAMLRRVAPQPISAPSGVGGRSSQASTGSSDSTKQRRFAMAQSGFYANQETVNEHYQLTVLDNSTPQSGASLATPSPNNTVVSHPAPTTTMQYASAETDDVYTAPDPQDAQHYTEEQETYLPMHVGNGSRRQGNLNFNGHSNSGYNEDDDKPDYANLQEIFAAKNTMR